MRHRHPGRGSAAAALVAELLLRLILMKKIVTQMSIEATPVRRIYEDATNNYKKRQKHE